MSRVLTIGVTGLNANDNPGPGLGVIRCLREAYKEVKIVGLVYDAMDPAIYLEKTCDAVFMIPYPSHGESAYLERMKAIQGRFPLDVFIPTLDAELPLVIAMAEELLKAGIKTFLPSIELYTKRSKATLSELASEFNFNVPKTEVIFDPTHLPPFEGGNLSYPLYVKGCFYEAYKANNPTEAVHLFHKIQSKWGLPVILQNNIPGVEFDVLAVGDGNGGHFGMLPMRKTYITDKGKAWGGISVRDKKLLAFCDEVLKGLKWRGPMEFEVMKGTDSKFYLIEVNPRFPAWVYFGNGCGINFPEQVVSLALGEKINSVDNFQAGMQFLRCSMDIVFPLKPFEELSTHGEIFYNENENEGEK